ncbi:hypothetical protein F383_36715 [Gossypium arboreum]|uniref:Uncharacterized protein n=1 Tax=Gossypium arboreum TaxID=29729 RepID=A0A0B0N918_GOSAR|nr:hypothetical protein F383_36715 [Gossypium arboreum]
MSISMGEN